MTRVARMFLAVWLLAMPVQATAHDAYDDSQSHPLRLLAYAVNPIGFALEWLVMRPIHFVVSQHELEAVFGHTPHGDPLGDYEPYQPEEGPLEPGG